MKKYLRICQAHSGLSAKIVEQAGFDGVWSSSLCDSASRCLPDIELVTICDRLKTIREIRKITKLSIIFDADTGGQLEHFPYRVNDMIQAGVDMIVIEDKAFPKKNSLDKNATHKMEDIDIFCKKIKLGVEAGGFIIARIESLIAKKSLYDALVRCEAYLQAGADGILIHSKQEVSADEVMAFAEEYKKRWKQPLVAIPSSYRLPKNHPFDIVVYANMMLRASMKAMQNIAQNVRQEDKMVSVKSIFNITGYNKL